MRVGCTSLIYGLILAACFITGESDTSGQGVVIEDGSAAGWAEQFDVRESDTEGGLKRERKSTAPKQAKPAAFQPQEHYHYEGAFLVLLVVYGINILYGRKLNENLALTWAREFCGEGTIFEHNFSLLGPGDSNAGEMLIKHSQSKFQFYASGRRYCSGMLATLDLKARQDLLSVAMMVFEPRDDRIDFEITMNDANMPPFCLAVGLAKITKTLHKEKRDLTLYAKPLEVTRDRIKDWPSSLSVVAESSVVFYDLFSDPIIEQAFSPQVYSSLTGKYLRYIHFSSDYDGTGKKVLRFSVKLPSVDKMHELGRLIEVMMKLIDVVGTYQMAPKIKEKAEKVRADERKKYEKSERKTLDEEIQRKKEERRQVELAKIKKMAPEAREKYEERQRKIEMNRFMKKRTKTG